jgi:hypothetical protein
VGDDQIADHLGGSIMIRKCFFAPVPMQGWMRHSPDYHNDQNCVFMARNSRIRWWKMKAWYRLKMG